MFLMDFQYEYTWGGTQTGLATIKMRLKISSMRADAIITTHTGSEIAVDPFTVADLDEAMYGMYKAIEEWVDQFDLGQAE